MILLRRIRAAVAIFAMAAAMLSCARTLTDTLLGEWKGHLTLKSETMMQKQAVTFFFTQEGTVTIVLDDGSEEKNTCAVQSNRTVLFTEGGRDKASARWEPQIDQNELYGPVILLQEKDEEGEPLRGVLRLKRVNN